MKKVEVKTRHVVITKLLKFLVYPFFRLKYGYKKCKTFKIKKNENVLVISNHQANLDPAYVGVCFNKPLYYVSTDTITTTGLAYKIIKWAVNPIPKKKGESDPKCVKKILKINKEKGSICLFAEGNRQYAEFQYNISLSTAKLIKKLNIPIVIFNIIGGNGVDPRFTKKTRKGEFKGLIKRVIEPSEYNNYSDEELINIIKDGIKVFDSESNNLYKSKERAEYLERMFFVCPKCFNTQCLVSDKEIIKCNSCGLEIEYTEDLKLKPNDKNVNIHRMLDWYNLQKDWVKNYNVNENIIFADDEVELYSSVVEVKRELLSKGKVILTKEKLIVGDYEVGIKDITMASPIGGRNLGIDTIKGDYLIKGFDRFNPLKYMLMFNKLDTIMKKENLDIYFNIN